MRHLVLSITFACVVLAQNPPTYPPFGPFSQLPAASGSVRAFTVTNCLTASCTAGGGSLKVLMVSDGSSWAPSGTGGGGTSQYVNTINVASMTVNAGNHTMAHILLPNQPSSGYPLSIRMTATIAVTGTVVSSVNGFIGDSSFDLSSYGSTQGASSVLFNGSIPGRTQDLSVLGSDFSQTYNLNALGTYSALYLTIQGNTGTDFSLAHAGTITVTLIYGGPAGPTGPTGSAGAPGSGNNALCADATGSTTAYTCPTPSPTVSTLTGLLITLVPQATNTASATVNVSGLGVKTLKTSDCSTNLSASALVGGSAYLFSYNGTVFCQSAGAGGGGSGTVTSVVIGGTTNQINVTGTCTITTTGTCTLSLPAGLVLPGTIDGLTITTTTGTLTIVNAKVLTVNKSLTLDGTDGVILTFPATNATIARTDAGQTFTGTQVFSSPISGSITGNSATATALAANGTNCSAGNYPLGVDASGNAENCTAAATGTVTSVATTAPVTGGPITGAGTIACPTCVISAASLTSNGVVIGGGSQASATIAADTNTSHALFATATAPAFRALNSSDITSIQPTSINGYGDSITAGSGCAGNAVAINGVTAPCYFLAQLQADLGNITLTNNGVSGNQACNMNGYSPSNSVFGTSNPSIFNNSLYTVYIGTNEANFGYTTAQFSQCHTSALAWLAISSQYKTFATTTSANNVNIGFVTTTGVWSADNTYVPGGTSIARQTTASATMTFNSLVTYGGPIYLFYRIADSNTATFTYQLDGGAVSAAQPVHGIGTISSTSGNPNTQAIAVIRITSVAAGTHSLVIAATGATSNPVSISAVGTTAPPGVNYFNGPTVASLGVQNLGAQYLLYNTQSLADSALLFGDGLPVIAVNVQAYTYGSVYDWSGLHPNTIGHRELANAIEGTMQLSAYTAFPNVATLSDPATPVNGNIWYNSTSNLFKGYLNGGTVIIPTISGSAPTSNDCAKWGPAYTLADFLAGCGGGAGSVSWDAITGPAGNQSMAMGAFTTTFTSSATSGVGPNWLWQNTASDTGTGPLVRINILGTAKDALSISAGTVTNPNLYIPGNPNNNALACIAVNASTCKWGINNSGGWFFSGASQFRITTNYTSTGSSQGIQIGTDTLNTNTYLTGAPGSGSNVIGHPLYIAGGNSTGTSLVTGKVTFLNSPATTTGSGLGTPTETASIGASYTLGTPMTNSAATLCQYCLADIDGSGNLVASSIIATTGAIGVASDIGQSGAISGGNYSASTQVEIAQVGLAYVQFDGAATAGDWVQRSTTTAGFAHDAGGTKPVASQIIGRVKSATTPTSYPSNVYPVILYMQN